MIVPVDGPLLIDSASVMMSSRRESSISGDVLNIFMLEMWLFSIRFRIDALSSSTLYIFHFVEVRSEDALIVWVLVCIVQRSVSSIVPA